MFGRSGQMFPRQQRAFHDAIYEEEYGSDHEEECCQGRGMSAIFCWLLSVIILIGLAASVVLTVFFLLKSKTYMSKNGELDLLYEGDNGINFHFPETTTELNSVDFSLAPSSKESSGPGRKIASSEEKNGAKTSTTRFPPSRKGPHQIFKESEEDEPLSFQTLYPNGKSTSSERNSIIGKNTPSTTTTPSPTDNESGKSRETGEESSSSEEDPNYLTTTSRPPVQHILFTSPPLTTTTTGSRRNLHTTRFPTERTSFTTSTEALDSEKENEDSREREEQDNDDDDETNGHSMKPPTSKEDGDKIRHTTITGDLVTPSTTQGKDDITYKTEESQLNKMLLEEIPPHGEQGSTKKNLDEDMKSTEFNLPSSPIDPLARIIKNLAPKWGRNRTIEVTTMSSGSHKYDFTISSREKAHGNGKDSKEKKSSQERYSSQEGESSTGSSIPSTTHSKSSEHPGGYGLNTIQSPDLSRRNEEQQDSPRIEGENPFLDILVGSEDHKTLVTKETEDGIVTSAILPPWYDNPTITNNNTAFSNANQSTAAEQEHTSTSSNSEEESNDHDHHHRSPNKDVEQSASSSVLGGIFDFFNKLPINRVRDKDEENKQPPADFNPNRIVLKRPSGELLPPGFIPQGQEIPKKNKNSEEQDNHLGNANIHTILPSNIMTTTIIPEAVVTDEDIQPANNAFHYGTPDGGTNIYGYYPDDDDKDNDKTVEHHMVQSETLSDPNELMEKGPEKSPSHSIELQINSDASSEVVIEQDHQGHKNKEEENEDYNPYTRYGETHAASGSEIRKQILNPPPQAMVTPLPLPTRLGEGIRRPINGGESTDLEMKGSENRPMFANSPARNIPPQLIRQRGSFPSTNIKNITNNSVPEKTTAIPNSYLPNSSISEEVLDNSAEHDPLPDGNQDFDRKTYHYPDKNDKKSQEEEKQVQHQQFSPGSASYEGGESALEISGSGEQPGKWSRPDPNNSMEQQGSLEQEQHGHEDVDPYPHPHISEEVKSNLNSNADENDVVNRKPVQTLDETLYPDHTESIENKNQNVFQVFPVGYSTSSSTTERPGSEYTISEPEKSLSSSSLSLDESSQSIKFVPPTPVNFHENLYTFSPPSSDSIYQSKDGWRPLVYNDGEGDSGPTAPSPNPTRASYSQPPQPTPPSTHWRDRLQTIVRQPVVTIAPMFVVDLSTAASENPISNHHISSEVDEHEIDDQLENHDEENESLENHKQESDGHVSWDESPQPQNHNIMQENSEQKDSEFSKIQFPQVVPNQISQGESHEQVDPNLHQIPTNNFQNNQNQPPTIQRIPMQIPVQSQPQQQQHQQQFQVQHHLNQNQHQHQRPQYQFQSNIDRSKYMMRPAPPPIVMRRTPIQSMGYHRPHNNPLPPRPQLIPQVAQQVQQVQHQFNNGGNNAPQGEFQHSHQNLVNRRRFKTLGGARPRGSVNWPEKQVENAERRNG